MMTYEERNIERVKTLNKKYANAKVMNGYIVGNPLDDGIVSKDDLLPCFQFDFPIWGVRDDDERIEKAVFSETSDIFKTLIFKTLAFLNANSILFVYVPKEDNGPINRRVRLVKTLSWGRELTPYEKEGMMEAVRRMVCTNIHIHNGCEMAA